MRYTEYHAGKAVIKDKSLLPQAMEKLAKVEDCEEMGTNSQPELPKFKNNDQRKEWLRCCFVQYYAGKWALRADREPIKITHWRPRPDRPERSET